MAMNTNRRMIMSPPTPAATAIAQTGTAEEPFGFEDVPVSFNFLSSSDIYLDRQAMRFHFLVKRKSQGRSMFALNCEPQKWRQKLEAKLLALMWLESLLWELE